MANTWQENFLKFVITWLLNGVSTKESPDLEDVRYLVEMLGFSAELDKEKVIMTVFQPNIKKKDPLESQNEKQNPVTNSVIKGSPENFLNFVKIIAPSFLNDNADLIKIFSLLQNDKETKEEIKTDIHTTSTPLRSQQSHEVSVELPTSSPVQQDNQASEYLNKIIDLAKGALIVLNGSSSKKASFRHRRLSGINPVIVEASTPTNNNNNSSISELNVTKKLDRPSLTPGRSIHVKSDTNLNKTISSTSARKSLLQPMKSKLQNFQSKLRTPILKKTTNSISSASQSPSPGSSRLPQKVQKPKNKSSLTLTPANQVKNDNIPRSDSRIKYLKFKSKNK